jgi:diguanylate cyclase (GGDEF)-like protein
VTTVTSAEPSSPLGPIRAAWGRRAVPERLQLFVVGFGALAALCAGTAAVQLWDTAPVVGWRIVLLLCLLPLSEAALLHVRIGGDSMSFTWGEGCLLMGFALVSPSWLVLLAWPCVFAVHQMKGRGLLKAAFNASSFTLASSMAALILTATRTGPYRLSHVADALALIGSVLVFSVISAVSTSSVVAVAQQVRMRTVLRQNARIVALVFLGNVLGAVPVLFLAERSPSTLFGVPPLMGAVYFVYRGYLRASQERDVWRQLEAAARELNHLEEDRLAGAALTRATQLLRANDAELSLSATANRPARLYRLVDGKLVCSQLPHSEIVPIASGITAFVELPPPGSGRQPSTVLATTLEGPQGHLGHLRLVFNGQVRLRRREEQVLTTFAHAVATTLLNVALHEDVRAEARKQAHHAAHDPLTGLANRLLLRERTSAALEEDGCSALLLIDLDHFKEINDTLGHAAGDILLQEVARRLLSAVAREDLVARLGGDEFAILLTGLTEPAQAESVAERILAALGQPVDYQGLHLSVEGSIGVASYPHDAEDAEELFRRADVAMYQAKADRGSWLRYNSLRDDSSIERLALVAELRAALDNDELVVHYQQQRDLETGRVVGAEALVRWQHPVRGLLQPSAFVGVAEQSGLVRPFTLRVLELAVAECAAWPCQQERPLSVAVNLGARSLLDRRLPDDVAAVLMRHSLAPERLVLEITETTATSELEVVEDVLGRLRRIGVEISVDDFGTGYSSLSFLQRTAVHELKVDRSFVAGMLSSDNDLALVRATVQLAHSLGARAVAEGVESEALAVALGAMGCDVAQGYHLGRPVPAAEFREQLSTAAVPAPRTGPDRHLIALSS